MSPAYFLYNAVISVAAIPLLATAAARNRLRGHWRERLGLMPRVPDGRRARIWLHAVSYGEVRVAAALISALKKRDPDINLWLTTSTSAGLIAAGEMLAPDIPVMTFPLDIYGSPGRALRRLKPDLLILAETEIWPNTLRAARKMGVRTMLANGRLTDRTVSGYRRFHTLAREVLGCLDLMVMTRPEYRDLIVSLGADRSRVKVADNVKYDQLLERVDPDQVEQFRRELGLNPGRPVLVAGSTRGREEPLVLDVYQRLKKEVPELHLILAPRHINRSADIETMIKGRDLSFRKRSDGPASGAMDVTLVDVMGELFYLYALGEAAFIGGSLVPLGGQNPLEPAAWAKPVLYGPFMDNFPEATGLLERTGAGRTVHDAEELYSEIKGLLSDPETARVRGLAGFEALKARPGSADQLAGLALDLLEDIRA